jgi:hypothetical protein
MRQYFIPPGEGMKRNILIGLLVFSGFASDKCSPLL